MTGLRHTILGSKWRRLAFATLGAGLVTAIAYSVTWKAHQNAFGAAIEYWGDDLAIALTRNEKSTLEKIARNMYSQSPRMIVISDTKGPVLTYPEETDKVACALNLTHEISRYSQKLGNVVLCFNRPRILFETITSGYFAFLLSGFLWALAFVEFQRRLVRARTEEQLKRAEALHLLAAQVAHDIRSPLAALSAIEKDMAQVPENTRMVARQAVGRIRDIANQLISRHQQKAHETHASTSRSPLPQSVETPTEPDSGEPMSCQLLSSIVDNLITEKRLQYRDRIDVEISFAFDREGYGLFSTIQPTELKRVLSNLINNSVEAAAPSRREVVQARISAAQETVRLSITDNGKGIPPEVLGRLGQQGETYGKSAGTGLGLFHAKRSVERWGGRLEIQSEPGSGTTVSLLLPRQAPPPWFLKQLELQSDSKVVVLDDDASIHQIWDGRLTSARVHERNVSAIHFSTPKEFKTWVIANPTDVDRGVFLIDYELLGFTETGLDLIEAFGLQRQSILVTSRFEEPAVLARCQRSEVRLLPKSMAGFVPIAVSP